jgi:tetratricopeptide repeat protein
MEARVMPRSIAVGGLCGAVLFVGQAVAAAEGTSAGELAYAEAQSAIAMKDCPAAVGHLKKVLATWPARADVHQQAGDCLMKLDRPVDALEHYREWARLEPADADAQAAVDRASGRQRQIETRIETRERERENVRRITHRPSLADVARSRERVKAAAVDVGETAPSDLAAASAKRTSVIDAMRTRAEAVLRPAMRSAAIDARALIAARRRRAATCAGTAPEPEAGNRWAAWTSAHAAADTPSEDSADCHALAGDIARLSQKVAGVLSACEAEMAKPPVVYRAVREEVFARLEPELW